MTPLTALGAWFSTTIQLLSSPEWCSWWRANGRLYRPILVKIANDFLWSQGKGIVGHCCLLIGVRGMQSSCPPGQPLSSAIASQMHSVLLMFMSTERLCQVPSLKCRSCMQSVHIHILMGIATCTLCAYVHTNENVLSIFKSTLKRDGFAPALPSILNANKFLNQPHFNTYLWFQFLSQRRRKPINKPESKKKEKVNTEGDDDDNEERTVRLPRAKTNFSNLTQR